MTALVWFRNDLRSLDHAALSAAVAAGPCRAVYFLCPAQLDEHGIAPIRRHYLRRALQALAEQLAELGIPFDIIDAAHFRHVPKMLADYCQQYGIAQVFAHEELLVDEMQRDAACKQALSIPLTLLDDCLIHPSLGTKDDGSAYKVFTPYSRRARQRLREHFPRVLPRPQAQAAATATTRIEAFGEERDSDPWPVTENAVLDQLREFCAQRAVKYSDQRNFPAVDGTSRLSAALALGVISPRQCLARLQLECGEAMWDAKSSAGNWFNELLWREFYRQVAFHFPQVVKGRAFQADTERLRWRNKREHFAAWQAGETGYPIVDAGMRQLAQTGWMHNRLRMVTASFLCKHLHIDWRWGERHFLEQLIDADFASNNGGWQWAASTGTDAVPYFRIFNPTTQSQRFDADGEFIKQFIPELRELSGKALHQPKNVAGYPQAIVDHKESRETCLALFQEIRD